MVKMIWADGSPPEFKNYPADFGMKDLSESQRKQLEEELEMWKEKRFIVPTDPSKLKFKIPLKAVVQAHKESTPVRPVMFYVPINKRNLSYPNEGLQASFSCGQVIRELRHKQHTAKGMLMALDIKKAYLGVFLNDEQQYYQGLELRNDKQRFYRMVRMGFGLNIAPKVLREIIQFILVNCGLASHVTCYVDDLFTHEIYVERLRKAMAKYGFDMKDPVSVNNSRVLGLENKDGRFRRRGELPKLEVDEKSGKVTRRTVLRWCAQLMTHYPIGNWLRPAVLTVISLSSLIVNYDDPVDETFMTMCGSLQALLLKRGDPVKGTWAYDGDGEWCLSTDASNDALGFVLSIGGVVVEDGTKLRRRNCTKHINEAELDAVARFIDVIGDYKRACNIKGHQKVTLFCDNKCVVAWLKRPISRNWVKVGGRSRMLIQSTLDIIDRKIELMKVHLNIVFVESERNPADILSRVPSELATQRRSIESLHRPEDFVPQEREDDLEAIIECPDMNVYVAASQTSRRRKENQVADLLAQNKMFFEQHKASGYRINVQKHVEVGQASDRTVTREYDQFGRTVIRNESELRKIVSQLHRHEGSAKLEDVIVRNFALVANKPGRRVMQHQRMREVVSDHVRNCLPCILGKDKSNVAPLKSSRTVSISAEGQPSGIDSETFRIEDSDGFPRGSYPHELVRMDTWVVAGDLPVSSMDAFAVTLIDSYSGFLMCLFLPRKPGSADAAELLRKWRRTFIVSPETVITDRGIEFQGEFAAACTELNVSHKLIAVNSSWQNGKVERIHNTLNNWLRAMLVANGSSLKDVKELIQWAEQCVEVHNTTMSESHGVSPHSLLFTFPSWMYDKMIDVKSRIARHWFPKIGRNPKTTAGFKFRKDDPKT